ncbi:conserved hypothetical protein [Nostocoides japonicum T1-X7]|uniref:Ppx/GppA phosphatase N-terminal domain-containing protein n=1 Tax=Nostocoides japonicum T1-X7 TaxID=1194083 RepID=A0A077LTY2_9MICO|nr:exopolyphosphatase [Tetrasphaera japonica]CCH77133.1 conserved hypothetical protein [Tetrasphaera japonica T1-X7]
MRLGVIDIGSNTVHLLVVDAHRGARPLPATSHKRDLRLSEHVTDDGTIDDDGVKQLVAFVHECQQVAEDQGVEEMQGFVTSAVREAPNGSAVLAELRDETGVDLVVLTGEQEARATFLAARRWLGWSAGTLLLLDIGGGSLEVAQGLDEDPDVAFSLPLGAGRLTRDQLPGDPPTPEVVREARRRIRAEIAGAMRPLAKAATPDRVVGTSKTFRSLARVAGAAPSAEGPYVVRLLRREDVTSEVASLSQMTRAERAELPGVSVARAGQLLAGALVAEAAMELFGVEVLEILPWALREGVILRRLDQLTD